MEIVTTCALVGLTVLLGGVGIYALPKQADEVDAFISSTQWVGQRTWALVCALF
jgi:hypothetical protein